MKNSDFIVNIRELQHYVYCPHRWGLIHIACDWRENAFISKAKLLHERADSGNHSFLRGEHIERSVKVYNDNLGILGVIDCLSLKEDKEGCFIPKYNGTFKLTAIEYKPTAPKNRIHRKADVVQLLAQKKCVDSVFNTDSLCCFYYTDIKKRQLVNFSIEDDDLLLKSLEQIRYCYENTVIPSVKEGQYCGGCSMKGVCLPKAVK